MQIAQFVVGVLVGAGASLLYTNVIGPQAVASGVPIPEDVRAAHAAYHQALASSPVGTHERLKMEQLFAAAKRTGYDEGDKLSFWQVKGHSYENYLAAHLEPIRMQKIKFLEIGLGCNMKYGAGRSLKLWADYLPAAQIWMAEYNEACIAEKRSLIESVAPGRVKLLVGSQADPVVLRKWLQNSGGGFDFIIDDGSHVSADIWLTLTTLWSGLAPGGVMVLEDLGETRFKRNLRSWRKQFANTTSTPYLMAAVNNLVTNLVDHGGGVSKRTTRKNRILPLPTYGTLPGLKSVQCFAESCAFMKCGGKADRLTPAARCP